MKNLRPTIFVYATVAMLAVLLAGCGSSSTPTPTPEATATATAAPPSPTPAASPTPTAVPEPIAMPSPSPAPTPTAQPAPATEAQRLADQAIAFLEVLTQEFSPRASATQEEKTAADFLAGELEALGYQVQLQPFTADLASSEVLVGPEAQQFRSFPLTLSGMGRGSGILVNVGRAFEDDIPPEGLIGKIALIRRGTITFERKVTRVAQAGAVAAVVYNDRAGLFGGTLMNQANIPAVSLSRQSGEAILETMARGDVEATVSATFETRDTQNVIADKPGTGEDDRVVVLGGHYDTVPDIPGANDNGSGIATLITVAREVSDKTDPFTLRFIAFGSEEVGLLGSRFYVDSLSPQEREATIAMLNFDALGTGDVVGVLGDPDLTDTVVEYGRGRGIAVERRSTLGAGSSSDHAPFEALGIPVIFFLADDFSRIHTPEDGLEFIQPELLGNSAALAIALLDSLAQG